MQEIVYKLLYLASVRKLLLVQSMYLTLAVGNVSDLTLSLMHICLESPLLACMYTALLSGSQLLTSLKARSPMHLELQCKLIDVGTL